MIIQIYRASHDLRSKNTIAVLNGKQVPQPPFPTLYMGQHVCNIELLRSGIVIRYPSFMQTRHMSEEEQRAMYLAGAIRSDGQHSLQWQGPRDSRIFVAKRGYQIIVRPYRKGLSFYGQVGNRTTRRLFHLNNNLTLFVPQQAADLLNPPIVVEFGRQNQVPKAKPQGAGFSTQKINPLDYDSYDAFNPGSYSYSPPQKKYIPYYRQEQARIQDPYDAQEREEAEVDRKIAEVDRLIREKMDATGITEEEAILEALTPDMREIGIGGANALVDRLPGEGAGRFVVRKFLEKAEQQSFAQRIIQKYTMEYDNNGEELDDLDLYEDYGEREL